MADLNERLRGIDRLTPPDLWESAQARAQGGHIQTELPTDRRVAVIALSLAIGLAAVAWVVIAIRPTTSPPFALDQPFAWPKNSCELVTMSEVEAATHSTVTQSGLLTDDQLHSPEDLNPCQYETDDEHTTLTVWVRPDDMEGFNRVRDRDPRNVMMLSGLGDEAFSTGMASVWVRVGSGYFVIGSQHGAGAEGVAELQALARLALGSHHTTLLVSSSGPSFDEALLVGTLTSESGCVGVSGGPGHFVNVVWPAGYSLGEEGDDVWVIDDSGEHVARFGDEVQMGGGITNLAHAEPSVPGGIPSSCEVGGPDAYWFAGTPEVIEASTTPSPGRAEVHAFVLDFLDARVAGAPEDWLVFMASKGVKDWGGGGLGGFIDPHFIEARIEFIDGPWHRMGRTRSVWFSNGSADRRPRKRPSS